MWSDAYRPKRCNNNSKNMPNLNTKPLTNPDALVRIRRESLLAWLAPAAEYFAACGAPIPE